MGRKRIAAHHVQTGTETLHLAVVELEDGCVVDYYKFKTEQANTLWLEGTIHLIRESDELHAYFQNVRLL